MPVPWLPVRLRRNGAVQFYAKDLTAEELAEASSYMTWLNQDSSSGLSAGAIAGIAVGSAVAVVVVAAAAFFVVQRRRRAPVTDAEAAMRVFKVREGSMSCMPACFCAASLYGKHGEPAELLRPPAAWYARRCECASPASSSTAPQARPADLPQDSEHPGTLSAKDFAGTATGSGTGKRSGTGKGSPTSSYLDSLSDLSRQTSADALALELGKEWMVDVSRVGRTS